MFMVARVWHGFTLPENADAYERFLKTEFLPSIEKKNIDGYRKFQLLRLDKVPEVEFITIMWFDSLDKIRQFAGEDYEKAVVHPKAQQLLLRYDDRSKHFELEHELNYSQYNFRIIIFLCLKNPFPSFESLMKAKQGSFILTF